MSETPSFVTTSELISSWREGLSYTQPDMRPILIACSLMSANHPKLLVPLVQQALREITSGDIIVPTASSATPGAALDQMQSDINRKGDLDDQVRFIRRLREALYKGSTICGGPYGINALGAVNTALDSQLAQAVTAHGPVRGPKNVVSTEEYTQRGLDLFKKIYQQHTETVLTRIEKTELCLVAALVPLDVPPQLKSHVYGARNAGVPMEQVQQLVTVAGTIAAWVQGQVKSSI
ncbi:hypothetical protein BGZ94_004025 [Podila epigama]|nr:hypothetical protein BGZ94_004025 [Podila epigama]